MTNHKLTKYQIEALRSIDEELADRLESGEAVTLELDKWAPKDEFVYAAKCSPEVLSALSLYAYREEFAPGYVVPPAGEIAWTPALCEDGKYRVFGTRDRIVGAIYMSNDFCQTLCDKLNSGEVVL